MSSFFQQHAEPDWFDQNTPQIQPGGGGHFHENTGVTAPLQGPGPFTGSSSYDQLVQALNQANAAPGSDAFNQIVKQYASALNLQGGPGNGFNWGQYDPSRTKIYVPGADLRYTNSVNGQLVNGWMAHPTGGADGGGGGGFGGSPEDIMKQDPGYQFRLREGLKAMQSSAASRGTLLTGGTQKALTRYGQNYAAGEFQSVFDRNRSLAELGKPT